MSSTQAAGFGVREALSSRHSPLGAGGRLLLQGVPDFLGETPLIAGGSLAMSMTASPNAVIRSAVNSGMSSTLRCWSFIAGLPAAASSPPSSVRRSLVVSASRLNALAPPGARSWCHDRRSDRCGRHWP